jgi:hypothetical protein
VGGPVSCDFWRFDVNTRVSDASPQVLLHDAQNEEQKPKETKSDTANPECDFLLVNAEIAPRAMAT